MKKPAGIVASVFAFSLLAASCDEGNPPKDSGDDQIQEQPVLNSGPETEAERAKDAVKDSSNMRDSSNKVNDLPDSVTSSQPHH
jgi:hypothetical protein